MKQVPLFGILAIVLLVGAALTFGLPARTPDTKTLTADGLLSGSSSYTSTTTTAVTNTVQTATTTAREAEQTAYTASTTSGTNDSKAEPTGTTAPVTPATQTSTNTYTAPATTSPNYEYYKYYYQKMASTTSTAAVQPNESAPRTLINTTPTPTPTATATTTQPTPTQQTTAAKPELIEGVGTSLRNLNREVKRVETAVREQVTKDVETALLRADSTAQNAVPPVRTFDPAERQKKIQEITAKLSQDVRTTVQAGEAAPNTADELQPVLKSSLDEIRLLIKSDTGVDVDLSPTARVITDAVDEQAPQLEKARQELLQRDGLDLYADSDRDGISNYDEKYIYGTNPADAYTAGSSLTDGERVLLGLDVFTKDTAQVPVESPKTAGAVVENVFEVHTINVRLEPIPATEGEEKSAKTEEAAAVPAFREAVTFAGRALPNSFVTLYIFSTPVVVTVKADVSGAWSYTLDSELEDGNHELYVATVDAGGRILAKSPAVPFVKRAEAAEFTPLLVPEVATPDPLEILQDNLAFVAGVAFLTFALIALIILGVLRSGPPKEPTAAL